MQAIQVANMTADGMTNLTAGSVRPLPGYYVIDPFTSDRTRAVLSGPWESPIAADDDRREYNIADDCVIGRVIA